MKTEVIMKREFLGSEISQKSKSEFLSATDLLKIGNKWRLDNGFELFSISSWLQNKSTKEFISELESKYGQVKINSKGKNSHTWVHPFLFLDLALAMNPTFKVAIYEWLHDNLLKFRNDSGDSYKMMAGALWERCTDKSKFTKLIVEVAGKIQDACSVTDWQYATEEQLKMRDKIHESIYYMSDVIRDINTLVDVSIAKTKKMLKISG